MHMIFGNRPTIKRLMVQEPLQGQGLLIVEGSRSHSIGLLWTSDQRDAQTSTWHHTTLTKDFPTTSGVRTPKPSKRVAADPCLRRRGHWDHEVWSQNINLRYTGVKFRRINGDRAHCSISAWVSFMSNAIKRNVVKRRRSDLSFRSFGYRPFCSLLLFMIRKRNSIN
jgi:hypothetical protein